MSYPEAAATLARTLGELTVARAGAALAPSPSPADDEIALHAGLRARGAVLDLVRVIAADVAPVTEREDIHRDRPWGKRISHAETVEVMRLGRLPIVAAFADAAAAHPQVPLRVPDTDPALSSDPRVPPWVSVAEQALVATTEYTRAGGATTDPQRWSAITDAGALAVLLTQLDTDLSASLGAHPLARPAALAALEQARLAGPRLAETAGHVREHASSLVHVGYALTTPEPHQVVRVDSPASLARGQRRLESLITDVKMLSPGTLAQILSTQERLASVAAPALREADPARASLARATARTLGSAKPELAALVTTLTSLHREDPAPAVQNYQIARYLRAMTAAGGGADPAALAGALDSTSGVLNAVSTSARASVLSGRWLTSDPVQARAAGPMGSYPWQRAEPATISTLVARLSIAAGHQSVHAARPPAATSRAPAQRPAQELLRDALVRRPAPTRSRGPEIGR